MMGERVKKFVAMGARIVGGCCGSTPEHVAAIARAVKGS
jgi:methionine synthase I (cobalamin-dependent)